MNLRSIQFSASSNSVFAAPANTQVGAIKIPSTPAEIKSLQESLNKWRMENGQGAINTSGVMDQDTKEAIEKFQGATGLNPDGKAGIETQKRLTLALDILGKQPKNTALNNNVIELLRSSGFKSLGEPGQTKMLNQVLSYAGSPSTAGNVTLLKNLVAEPGFDRLSPQSKDHMLKILAARPGDSTVGNNLLQIAGSPNFRDLDAPTQDLLLKRFERYGGNSNKIENLEDLITETQKFAELPKKTRDFLIRTHIQNPDNAVLGDTLRHATNSQNFRNMPQPLQEEMLNHVRNYPPRDFGAVDNLMELMMTPKLQDVSLGVRDQILTSVPHMFQDVKLDSVKINNLMKLASAPGFEKLNESIRQDMLNALALRPDNVQLAEALAELANSAKFRDDKRSARQTIMKVDESIR